MAKFKHLSDTDWGWISTFAGNLYRGRSPQFKPFETVQLTGDQFCVMFEELNRIATGEMVDQDDVNAICARIQATVERQKQEKG